MKKIVFVVLLVTAMALCCACSGGDSSYSSYSSGAKCAMSGCNRSAVTSGNSVYCAQHSNRCLNCNKYIDADAMYCMSCLRDALGN